MKQLTAHEISNDFLNILKIVQNGDHIVITGDNEYEKLAVVPYKKYSNKGERVAGNSLTHYEIQDQVNLSYYR